MPSGRNFRVDAQKCIFQGQTFLYYLFFTSSTQVSCHVCFRHGLQTTRVSPSGLSAVNHQNMHRSQTPCRKGKVRLAAKANESHNSHLLIAVIRITPASRVGENNEFTPTMIGLNKTTEPRTSAWPRQLTAAAKDQGMND